MEHSVRAIGLVAEALDTNYETVRLRVRKCSRTKSADSEHDPVRKRADGTQIDPSSFELAKKRENSSSGST
jgi:hypothetical protein